MEYPENPRKSRELKSLTMKKIIIRGLFATVLLIGLSSCQKTNYCAACQEANTGYKPADFCGSESDVDEYISELKSQGAAVGQSWSCQKKEE